MHVGDGRVPSSLRREAGDVERARAPCLQRASRDECLAGSLRRGEAWGVWVRRVSVRGRGTRLPEPM
jgi:hypothetical protein